MTDLRYALRVLAKSPGFASVAVLSLALGIGANTAIYSVVRTVLEDPLPIPDPDGLMAVTQQWVRPQGMPGIGQINGTSYRDRDTGRSYGANFTYPLYRALRETASDSADLFAYTFLREVNVSVDNQSVVGGGALVSGNYFRGLGVSTVLGRALTEDDDRPDGSAAVLSYGFWMRAFGGDRGIVGKPVRINGQPFTIVGVSAPGFFGVSRGGFFPPTDITMPLAAQPHLSPQWNRAGESLFQSDDTFWLQSMARLKPGASRSQLEAALSATFGRILKQSSSPTLQRAGAAEVRLMPGAHGVDTLSRRIEQPLRILSAVVLVVLLIACVNLGNLMLARGAARQKELSIRLALGSGRFRLARQVLIESALVATIGGTVGLLLGILAGRALLATFTAGYVKSALTISFSWRLLAMTAAASTTAGLLSGLVPALRAARGDLAPSLKNVNVGGHSPRLGAGRVLMAAQIAISVPLLVGAGLFLRTVYNLGKVDLGFNPQHLALFRIDPSLNGYDRDRVERIYAQVLDRIEAIPGVASATLIEEVLMRGVTSSTNAEVDGRPVSLFYNHVGPRYFETMGVPIVAGRGIGIQDHSRAPAVAVVNENAVRQVFGGTSPLGRRIHVAHRRIVGDRTGIDFEVVGVARDSKYDSVRKSAEPTMFVPYAQFADVIRSLNVAVRSAADPAALAGALREAVREVDPDVPVTDMTTQAEQINESLGAERTFMQLLVTFGLFALLLASIGLHGVTAYAVARRTSEIGVRIALGAQRTDVLWLILRQVVAITLVGLAVGVPASIAATRLVRATLYGVEPADPLSLAAAAAVMAIVAGLAGFLPARRAAGLDPLAALRYE